MDYRSNCLSELETRENLSILRSCDCYYFRSGTRPIRSLDSDRARYACAYPLKCTRTHNVDLLGLVGWINQNNNPTLIKFVNKF